MIVDVGLRRFSGNAIQRQALLILQSYGADAHSYIPGIGTVSGLVAGNWEDSAGTIPATKDGLVGKVDDATSTIDLTQATTANKPFLRKGAVNLLLRSEEFDNASWTKSGSTVSANAIIAPDGTLTADKLVEDTANSQHRTFQSYVAQANTYTYSAYIKAAGRNFAELKHLSVVPEPRIVVNLTTGQITGATNVTSSSATDVGDGWWRVSMTYTTTTSVVSNPQIAIFSTATNGLYLGDGTSGIYVWGAMLQTGISLSTYVRTVAAQASNGVGNYHWVFDSTDLLSGTFPAGYESATIIDSRSTGTVTQTAQNIVGTYSIGTSVDTYGRFIFRTGLTASETVIMQQFANSLRGF